MDYPFESSEVEGKVVLRLSMLGAAKLFLNDQPAPRGDKHGTFRLPKTNGGEATVRIVPSFGRTVPTLEVDGVKHELGEKVAMGMMVMSFLPLGLIAVGGALGGACGGAGWAVNQSVLRSQHSSAIKVLIMLGVTLGAIALWIALATMFHAAVS